MSSVDSVKLLNDGEHKDIHLLSQLTQQTVLHSVCVKMKKVNSYSHQRHSVKKCPLNLIQVIRLFRVCVWLMCTLPDSCPTRTTWES